jgi:hypothetical protein
MERIKNKIRNSNGASVHSQLIDTENVNVAEDRNEYVNVNVDANINANDLRVESAAETRTGPAKREKRKKFEELYKRDTFWIQNDLKDRLDAYCKGERGEKTRIVNEALKEYMDRL